MNSSANVHTLDADNDDSSLLYRPPHTRTTMANQDLYNHHNTLPDVSMSSSTPCQLDHAHSWDESHPTSPPAGSSSLLESAPSLRPYLNYLSFGIPGPSYLGAKGKFTRMQDSGVTEREKEQDHYVEQDVANPTQMMPSLQSESHTNSGYRLSSQAPETVDAPPSRDVGDGLSWPLLNSGLTAGRTNVRPNARS
jgi:hypothetical protein